MEFRFETTYDQKALTAMAKGLRKTIRQKRSRRSHIVGWAVAAIGLLLSFVPGEDGVIFGPKAVFTWAVVLIMIAALIWEDRINGFFAKSRLLKGTEHAVSVFNDGGFTTRTDIGMSEWNYDKIAQLAETQDYYIFIFSQNHAQVYDKSSLSGGDGRQFCEFIENKTGKKVKTIK